METQLKDFTQTVTPKVVIVELIEFCEDEQTLFPRETDGIMGQARWRKSVIDEGMEEENSSMEENRQGLSSHETKMGQCQIEEEHPDIASELQSYRDSVESNDDPLFPPGFEPAQQTDMSINKDEIEANDGDEKEYDEPSQFLSVQGLKHNNVATRSTRRSTRILDQMKEAKDTWELGKKLGLFTEDEEAVIKELTREESSTKSDRPRKRGRPRKTNP